jgi:hypothetical protein
MNQKPQPNRDKYIEILRGMSPEQRLAKAFELSEFAKGLFLQGLRNLHPEATEEEVRKIYLARLAKCHNRNY